MDSQLTSALTALIRRIESAGQIGTSASGAELQQLEANLGLELPEWFRSLLLDYPIGGIELGIPSKDEEVDWMEWSTVDGIRSESIDCIPGCVVLKAKWINVAGCSIGSGDPYFVPLDQNDNPPLCRVFHERYRGEYEEIEGLQYERVADSLSGFFDNAILE